MEIPQYHKKDYLYHQFIVLGISIVKIAEVNNISKSTIRHHLRKHNIKKPELLYKNGIWLKNQFLIMKRSRSEIAKTCNVGKTIIRYYLDLHKIHKEIPKYKNGIWLKNNYINLKKSMQEMAEICESTVKTIRKYLKLFKIPQRTISEVSLLYYDNKRRNELNNTGEPKYPNKKYLYHQFIKLKVPISKIAEINTVSKSTVRYHLGKHKIKKPNENDKNANELKNNTKTIRERYKEYRNGRIMAEQNQILY